MNLQEYVDLHGAERVAEELTVKLGRPISPHGVKTQARRQNGPKTWQKVLGLASADSAPVSPRGDGQTSAPFLDASPEETETEGRQSETTPKPPDGARILQPVPLRNFAIDRISKTYQFVGYGLGEGLGNHGITRVWDDSAPEIAKAWVEAAETSEFARRFVQMMTAGGPMGEVIILHVTLLAGTLYVIGQFPEVGLFGKYRGYRPAPAAPGSGQQPSPNGAASEQVVDGAVAAPAEDQLGEPPFAAVG